METKKRLEPWKPNVSVDRLTDERIADLVRYTKMTRVIDQLTIENQHLNQERDALAAEVAEMRKQTLHTYVACDRCGNGVRHSYGVPVDKESHKVYCPHCAAEIIWQLEALFKQQDKKLPASQKIIEICEDRYGLDKETRTL